MLHVIFSSHLEWKDIWHKLPGYHLLMPDLPCHSQSKDVCRQQDFSVELCTEHVADMIRKHAHDGRAHVVGFLDGGGWTTMELTRRYPELVKSAYVAGAWPLTGIRATIANCPRLTYTGLWALLHSPAGKKMFFAASGLSGEYCNDELLAQIKANMSSRLAKAALGCNGNPDKGYEWLGEVGRAGVRMVFMAGAVHDSIPHARKAGQVINAQERGDASVFVVPGASHAWNLQFPVLFARSVQCWVEGRPMPAEFEALAL